jgi:hypothetical protein
MANAREPLLYQHVISKHPADTPLTDCFDQLKDYDPEDPKGLKKISAAGGPVLPKPKKQNVDLDLLLDAGIGKGKKK